MQTRTPYFWLLSIVLMAWPLWCSPAAVALAKEKGTRTTKSAIATPRPEGVPVQPTVKKKPRRGTGTKVTKQTAASSKSKVGTVRRQAAATKMVGVKSAPEPSGPRQRMDQFLREQQTKGHIRRQERSTWAAYDLTREAYVVSVNTERSFQAASMIKPLVALAFFHQVDAGKLRYTAKHQQMLAAMIQRSDNGATNWFLRQLGGPRSCETILKRSYGSIFRQVRIREYIPAGGRTYINSAPAVEYVRFLRALWNEQLPHAKEILRVMSLPGPDRILSGTDLPRDTLVYNKTGTTAHLCGDMGILAPLGENGHRVPYIIVGMVEGSAKPADYKQWMLTRGGAIRDFSSLVYDTMRQRYHLR